MLVAGICAAPSRTSDVGRHSSGTCCSSAVLDRAITGTAASSTITSVRMRMRGMIQVGALEEGKAMRMLVVGAGSIGGLFGVRLIQAGRDVSFLVRPARAAHIRQHGL